MEVDKQNDSDQFSDNEIYDNLGNKDFDLFKLTEEERTEHANVINDDDSESGDELDDEILQSVSLFQSVPANTCR